MDSVIDISLLSLEDVREEYGILFERYRQMCVNSENDAQKIYELKRHLETAQAAEEYLTQELEQANNDSKESAMRANLAQFQDLQREHAKLQLQFNAMQTLSEQMKNDNEHLVRQIEEMTSDKLHKKATDEENKMANLAAAERAERLRLLEKENLELYQKLDELQEENVRHVVQINDKEGTIEMLRDRLQCVEENLRCKRDELEETTQMLESAQEQLSEANGRIALLTAAPESAERKGNSLFAEVDDQRQVMKQILAAQKRSYMEMKKVYQESQYEIRRLKNENIAMHNELDACSKLFCNSNKTYQEKLLQRLLHANNEKDLLERHLQLLHNRLRDLTNNKGIGWLDSMLNFCKQETDELKKQLHSSRIQQASLEEQLRNISQEVARWRFEALRSRCLLLDRENLLNNNNITFKANNAVEFRISDAELQDVHPRIMTNRYSLDANLENGNVEAQTNTEQEISKPTSTVESSVNELEKTKSTDTVETSKCELEKAKATSPIKTSENDLKMCKPASPVETSECEIEKQEINLKNEMEVQKLVNDQENKENLERNTLDKNENKENLTISPHLEKKLVSSKRSSILSKKPQNLLLCNEATKSVKFSASPPTVHNLSASEPASAKKESSIVTTKTFKQMRNNKSGLIVVRNVVFKPSSTKKQHQNSNP